MILSSVRARAAKLGRRQTAAGVRAEHQLIVLDILEGSSAIYPTQTCTSCAKGQPALPALNTSENPKAWLSAAAGAAEHAATECRAPASACREPRMDNILHRVRH